MTELQELRHIIEILPELEENAMKTELLYRRELSDNIGRQENGFVYHVRPTVFENYLASEKEYRDFNERRWYLIRKLQLPCSVNGIPDFGENNIKPYGLSDKELYKINQVKFRNSPIDLPYGY